MDGGESSSPSEASTGTPAAPNVSTQQPATTVSTKIRRRPVPSKGHSKSRAGCTSCKKRRVKCDEKLPICGSCRRLALTCEYNRLKEVVVSAPSRTPIRPPLRTTPGTLEMSDLRFFHHFLLEAYPPLPVLGREVWHQVSQMVHQYDFLARAILGLGASHLSLIAPTNHSKPALKHRIASMSALNKQLPKAHLGRAESDATLAALLALTFQSAYMEDGMVEFLTLIRGCVLVAMHGNFNFDQSAFKSLAKEEFYEIARKLVGNDVNFDKSSAIFAKQFLASLSSLEGLCTTTAEIKYIASMTRIAKLALKDPVESFCENSSIFNEVGELSDEEFSSFVDPDNYPSQLVLLHLFALDFVMSRKAVDEASDSSASATQGRTGFDGRRTMTVVWIEKIMSRLTEEYRPYAEGAATIVRQLTTSTLTKDGTWKPLPPPP